MRLRLRQAGLPRPEAVFMVSAVNGFGIKEMLTKMRDDMGFRADLWVVGAQNGELRHRRFGGCFAQLLAACLFIV